jgi:hypothetical protein
VDCENAQYIIGTLTDGLNRPDNQCMSISASPQSYYQRVIWEINWQFAGNDKDT